MNRSIGKRIAAINESPDILEARLDKEGYKPGEFIQQDFDWIPSRPTVLSLKGYAADFQVESKTLRLETKPLMFKALRNRRHINGRCVYYLRGGINDNRFFN